MCLELRIDTECIKLTELTQRIPVVGWASHNDKEIAMNQNYEKIMTLDQYDNIFMKYVLGYLYLKTK